jgi:uncharacterized protein (DUF302 family)
MLRNIPLYLTMVLVLASRPVLAADKSDRPVGRAAPVVHSLDATVVKMPLAKGISLDDAAESMKLRANYLNMKLVAELPLSKQVEAITGKPEPRATIYQFCDAMTARQMLNYSLDFAAYLPCRIALVQDSNGQGWLVMMDLNPLIKAADLPPEIKARAEQVRNNLENIMQAGANGDL